MIRLRTLVGLYRFADTFRFRAVDMESEVAKWTEIVGFAHQLGGVTEANSYGEPSLKIGNVMLTRLRVTDQSIVLKYIDPDERDILMLRTPELFFIEDHYIHLNIVLARISNADLPQLAPFIERTWRQIAPKRIVAAYDGKRTPLA